MLSGLWGNLAILAGLGPVDPGSNPGSPMRFKDTKWQKQKQAQQKNLGQDTVEH